MESRKKMSLNYGVKGWILLVYLWFAWMVISGAFWTARAQNVMISAIAENIGTSEARLLAMNSIAGYIAVICIFFVAGWLGKYKTHLVGTIIMIVCGLSLIVYGRVTSLTMYFIIFILVDLTNNVMSNVGLPQICNAYFPTKQGSFRAIATTGSTLSSLIALPILTSLVASKGTQGATLAFGIFVIAMGLLNWFFIPNDPEKANFQPDNGDFTEEELAEFKKRMSAPPTWTVKEAIRNKNFWLLGIAYGALMMCSIGFISQYVPFMISNGMAPPMAAKIMTFSVILTIPGTIINGILVQRFGGRRVGILMAICFAIVGITGGMLPPTKITLAIFSVVFFWWASTIASLGMSHAASVFGPRDYPMIWGKMAFLVNLCRVNATMILSFSLAKFGTYRGAYAIFACISIVCLIFILISDEHVFKEPGEAPTGATKTR